jgi:hypothetical protein
MSFTKLSVFNLNKPLAPCLVQALYIIALVLITLGLVRGIVGGVRMMSGQPPAIIAMAATPQAGDPAAPPPPPPMVGGERRYPGFGPRGRRFHGRPIMGGMLRGAPAPVLGALRILGAFFVAAVAAMVVRVLAEIANAILAMGAKARS